MINYVSLHNHTSFSLMRGLVKPIDLFTRAKELGQSAIAVTDAASFAGMWDSLAASRETGVKLIAGCEFNFVNDVKNEEAKLRSIVLLAKNAVGYRNILTLNKKGFDNATIMFKKPQPRVDWAMLKKYSEGVICLTGDGNGIIAQLIMSRDFDAAKDQIQRLHDIFKDDFALELQPHDMTRKETPYSGEVDQRFINKKLKEFGGELGIRCVVTTDTHYLNKEHHSAHDVVLSIASGQPISSFNRLRFNVDEFHLKTGIEAAHYFVRKKHQYDPDFIQQALANTVEFAARCEFPDWIDPKHSNPSGKELPEFPVKDAEDYFLFKQWKAKHKDNTLDDDVLYLRYRCGENLHKVPKGKEQEYRERLIEELDVLEYHGFSSYMLIVSDYVQWAKDHGIGVGPGRGSVGGCLISYLLDIHIVDPIKHGLIFSRFHNKEKTSYPDIDLDFATAGRDRVINYIRDKYGEDFVAHVSNVNTITPKVYVRDIARTFEFGDSGRSASADIGNQIADTIPTECKTLDSAFEASPLFAAWADEYPKLKEFAKMIGGISRAWSTHAGGVVIGRRPLTGLVPLRKDKEGSLALEYEKERAEENGLVKMDVLGLTTLDVLEDTYRIIELVGKPLPPKMPDYEQYDEKTYDLISRGDTFCVFQLTGVAAPVCKMLQPKSIYDLALITALIRPAAKDIIPDFMQVRSGEKKLELMHPTLDRALRGTYGFGLFEECLMYIAADVAGWDLHKADDLRKMTKGKGKYPEKVKKLRKDFIKDAQENKGLPKATATKIWDELIGKFGGYGFNLSHAFLYSIISFYTAYMKAHYPLEFLVANLMFEVKSNSPKSKNNIIRIKEEIRSLGVNIVPPDLNSSVVTYKIIDKNTLMTGLDALKYMGKDAIPEILKKRPFISFEDFLTKIDGKLVRAPAIQALAASGSLDDFGITRKTMFLYASDYKKKLQVHLKKQLKDDSIGSFKYPFPDEGEWSESEKFALEVYFLGEGMSGTLNERYPGFFNGSQISYVELDEAHPWNPVPKDPLKTSEENAKELRKANQHNVNERSQYIHSIRGIVRNIFSFTVKKKDSKILGQEMAIITIQDHEGNDMSLVTFPDGWRKIHYRLAKLSGGRDKLEEGVAVQLQGVFQHENEHRYSFIFNDILDYSPIPSLPEDRKSRKVKLPRTKRAKKNIKKLNKEELFEELEDELIEDGIDPIDDPDMIEAEEMFR